MSHANADHVAATPSPALTPPPARVVVFRALKLGDMLCAVPALRALRAGLPRAHITLIGLPWARDFQRRYHRYLDAFEPFPGAEGLPEQPAPPASASNAFYARMKPSRFDLAVQMHGSGERTNRIVARLGAARVAGFCPAAAHEGSALLPWPVASSEVESLLALVRHLGIAASDTSLEFPLSHGEEAAGRTLAAEHGLRPRGYAIVHPGAAMPSRRWPADRFAEVCGRLDALMPVVLTGTDAERSIAEHVDAACGRTAIDLTSRTSLGVLGALVRDAAIVLCNDTGISHLAAAMRTPSVVVACGSDVARWAPANKRLHRVVWSDVPCRPCAFEICPYGHECAENVLVDRVWDEVQSLLGHVVTERSTLA